MWGKPPAAAAAKSLQSCPTLCDPIDGSPPGSPIPGILQARTLEWVAISFSTAWKWKVKVKPLSHVRPSATPWIVAYQAPLSMGFSRQEYWSGVPLPSPSPLVSFNLFFLICSMPDGGRLSSHPRTWIPLEDGSHLLECSRERRVMWLSDNDGAAIPPLDYQVWASFYTKERWTVLSKSFFVVFGRRLGSVMCTWIWSELKLIRMLGRFNI